MIQRQRSIGGVLVILLAMGNTGIPMAKVSQTPPQQLAQRTTEVTGELSKDSQILDDGSYFNIHTFEGSAGEIIRIDMVSEYFDTYLILLGPDGNQIRDVDSSNGSTNARLVLTLPSTGTYQILANSYWAKETGHYTLTWQPATAADIAQAIAFNEAIERANALNRQGLEFDKAYRRAEAEPFYLEALAIYREQLGERHPFIARNLINHLALVYKNLLRYSEAESLLLEALEIHRENFEERHPLIALNLNSLAILYQSQGRYSEAELLFLQVLKINREIFGERHPRVATDLANLAGLYYLQGRYSEIEPLQFEALEIRRELDGEERLSGLANSLGHLAFLYQAQGRYQEAEALFLEVQEIERELGVHDNYVAINLRNLALVYQAQGRYQEAEALFLEALNIYRKIMESGPSVVIANLADGLNSLGVLYSAQGRYSEAEPLFLEALNIYRGQPDLGERHTDIAPILNSLGILYGAQGRYSEAEPLFLQALEINRENLGERHPDVATNLGHLAVLYQAQGHSEQAVSTLQMALELEEWNLSLNLAVLNDVQRQAYVATISRTTNLAVSLHLQAPSKSTAAAKLALTTLLRRKGRIQEMGVSSWQALRQNLTVEDRASLDEFLEVRRELAALTFNPPPNLPPEQYQARLTQLETKMNQLEATLARQSATLRSKTQPVEIASVQSQIPNDGALVEYIRYRPHNNTADNSFGTPRYAAYILFSDGRIESVDLGDAAKIDAAVQSFTRLLQDRSADFQRATAIPTIRPDVVEGVTDTLKALVFDPIAPYLQNTQHLLISPDSQLNRLPFEALQPETGGDYLVQQYQISYLNSGRDLPKFNIAPSSNNPAIILANPDYNTADDTVQIARTVPNSQDDSRSINNNRRSTELSQLKVQPLLGTAAEAQAIKPLLPKARLFDGIEATENVLKTVQAPRILHIATHGFFLPNIERSTENPLLRSGLAFAGFNNRSSGNEDGVLTALEASNLNLFGTQLVVLSACETGLGDISNGEGVYGLRRAFALAGAETQLMSLWQVSDFGTKNLMARYYEKLNKGMGRSEALRSVQLEMIEEGGDYGHPYYWAAFVLAGDWRQLE